MEAPDKREEASVSVLVASVLAASVVPLREKRRVAVSVVGVDGAEGVVDGVLKRVRGASVAVGDVASGVVVPTRRLGVVSLGKVGVVAVTGVADVAWLSALFCFLILAISSSSLT